MVIPGHCQPATPDTFSFSVDYLDTLITEVQASVFAAHDLEMTQAAVTMEEFRGYALWGWLHPMVNVPITYAEPAQ